MRPYLMFGRALCEDQSGSVIAEAKTLNVSNAK